jgi:hypothetical protein
MIDVRCNYCDELATVKNNYIRMNCHCCDENRIIPLQEHLDYDRHKDYLYSMVDDNFVFNDEK